MSNLLEKIENKIESKFHPERQRHNTAATTGHNAYREGRVPAHQHTQIGHGPTAGQPATAAYPSEAIGPAQPPQYAPQADSRCFAPSYGATEYITNGSSGPASATAGPHRSNLLNRLDPRVTSDLDYQFANTQQGGFGRIKDPAYEDGAATYTQRSNMAPAVAAPVSSGALPPDGGYVPHGSRLANSNEPIYDVHDVNWRGRQGVQGVPGTSIPATAVPQMGGPGPTPNTGGPHRSDLLNRLDPRVESRPVESSAVRPMEGSAPGGTYW